MSSSTEYAHIEWIDVEGLQAARRDVEAFTPEARDAARRKAFLLAYLDAIDRLYGPVLVGPGGRRARSMRCVYSRVRGGRLYCRTQRGPEWNGREPSYVCAQGMPKALRPYLMRHWAHDIDIENCHVALMYQLGQSYHLWPEHDGRVEALRLEALRELYEHRAEFIEHVADVHGFPTDAERHIGYRKDLCKPLFLRILYGGTYEAWLRDHGLFFERRSHKVMRLQREIEALRMAILRSRRFAPLVQRERAAQQSHDAKSIAAIDRGTFSKVAQSLECKVLLAMRAYLLANGWRVLSLVFDGLMVQHRCDVALDLDAMASHVERETHFALRIVEKPLYRAEPRREDLFSDYSAVCGANSTRTAAARSDAAIFPAVHR